MSKKAESKGQGEDDEDGCHDLFFGGILMTGSLLPFLLALVAAVATNPL